MGGEGFRVRCGRGSGGGVPAAEIEAVKVDEEMARRCVWRRDGVADIWGSDVYALTGEFPTWRVGLGRVLKGSLIWLKCLLYA